MDKTLVILLISLASCYAALEANVFGSSSRVLEKGGSLNLTCHLNMGLEVILSHTIHWVLVPMIPGAQELVLTKQQDHMEDLDPALREHFVVAVDYSGPETNVTLSILNAKSSMDGKYICRVVPKTGDIMERTVEILVPSNVESVQLNFDGEEVSEMSTVTVQREEGQFGVSCRAAGFNPSASLHLFLGDQPLQAGAPQIDMDSAAVEAAGARRFKSAMAITKLQLAAANSGQTLKCVAKADFDGATESVASIPLEIIALEPLIVCDDNSTGHPGDKYVEITCRVNHERVEVERYSFEIGDTGEIITPDEDSAFHDSVTVTEVEGVDATDEVMLTIYEADEMHFNTVYYLDVYLKNGQRFRQKAMLIKHDISRGSSTSAAYLLCLLLVALVWSL